MIERLLKPVIEEKLNTGKAIILLGARQTGKTTLLKHLVENKKGVLWLNGDEPDTISIFDNATSTLLRNVFTSNNLVIIDEAQRILD